MNDPLNPIPFDLAKVRTEVGRLDGPLSIKNPCSKCDRPHRLLVKGSPDIEGKCDQDQDVLICGQCGHTEPVCSACQGRHLVLTQVAAHCLDCSQHVVQDQPVPPVHGQARIGVRWGSEKGYLELTNPLTGERVEIPAKGAARWLLDRVSIGSAAGTPPRHSSG